MNIIKIKKVKIIRKINSFKIIILLNKLKKDFKIKLYLKVKFL